MHGDVAMVTDPHFVCFFDGTGLDMTCYCGNQPMELQGRAACLSAVLMMRSHLSSRIPFTCVHPQSREVRQLHVIEERWGGDREEVGR